MASEDDTGPNQRWNSFSDYDTVVESVAERVEAAIDAHGHLNACESQMVTLSDSSAIRTKRALVGAGTRLKPEVRHNKDIDPFDDVWDRWNGEDNHIAMLQAADFIEDVPGWLDQYVDDITTVAWELGYLKAGREEPAEPDDDEVKVREVIE